MSVQLRAVKLSKKLAALLQRRSDHEVIPIRPSENKRKGVNEVHAIA